jgi:BlaI family penicillinase repressor
MAKVSTLSESEWLIMSRLWEKSPLTAAEIVEKEVNGKTIPNATVRTLLRRLVAKDAVDYNIDEHNANLFHYFPLIKEDDYARKENKHFLEVYYRNNVSKLFASFMEDVDLSDEEIEQFKQMLDAKKKDD